ncbi:LysR family transcriptional regulator [Actinomadura sp. WMMB 499]|uniref:LysR family transcriptional regulator n=1 Tax=Actinomadura sp. WMMB 499 TaxID=1219491 RepID=UPI00124405F8|nr:LysR family transcriptional regulator [Actinomadura sp. WMMB 499]QFG22414.1 LysR family transcriptional regulator [Actinomadura sp. WMMB 499]
MELGRFDLNLLVVLDALLREKNVTLAARRLHLSQPGVSTALSRLRKMLDDPLLVRQGRYLALTPRAEALIEPVREILATIEQNILQPPQFDPERDTRTFSVLSSDYVGIALLRPLLTRINDQAARVRIDMTAIPAGWLDQVKRDEVDLAIVPDRMVTGDDVETLSNVPVIEDRFVAVVWKDHPVAAEGRLTASDLGRWPYLAYAPPQGTSLVEDGLDELGITRSIEATGSNFASLAFLLPDTMMIAFLPERLATRVAPAAHVVTVQHDFPLRPLTQSAFWHQRRDRDGGHVWLRQELLATSRLEFDDLDRRT